MPEKPNPCNLKLVMVFDLGDGDDLCSISSHNLNAEEAERKWEELGEEGFFSVILDQPARHPADDPHHCAACQAEVAWLLAKSAGAPEA
jgi:hypothetical protein